MKKARATPRDFQALKSRRMRAAKMFAMGKSQADVARHLEVSRQSVSRWFKDWERSGKGGLVGAGRAGRRPKLSSDQLKQVEKALRQGPRAHGFETELWTLSRLSQVIENLTGVRHHRGHVWRLMAQIGWTLQRPAKRAKERNQRAILQWMKKEWPRIKKKPAG